MVPVDFHLHMFIVLILPLAFSFELPYGVPYTKSAFYQVDKPFTCLDGSSVIPWTKVNDDYCDCMDGSDEPGTAACRRGVFYCKDIQYKLQAIPSAYIKDGYCDCCDGSDEIGSGVLCESNCGQLAAAMRHAKSVRRKEIEEGHELFMKHAELLKIENARREAERLAAEQAAAQNHTTEGNASAQEDVPDATHAGDTIATEAEPHSAEGSTEHHTESETSSHPVDEQDDSPDADQPEPPSDEESPQPPKDYGPENIFQVLDDMQSCLEFNDQKYTYELCGLREVFQREGSSSKISLGTWAGWGGPEASDARKYDVMLFKNGLPCWNGPSRSTTVYVHCGPSNEIINVSEPSPCEYVINLRTFAACFEDPDVLFKRLHPGE